MPVRQDVKASDEELEALQAEIDSMRQSSSIFASSFLPPSAGSSHHTAQSTHLNDDSHSSYSYTHLPGPPGLPPVSSVQHAEQMAEELRATIRAATAALKALEENIRPETQRATTQTTPSTREATQTAPPTLSRSRSEGPHGPLGILSRHERRGRSLDGLKRRVSFDGDSAA